MPTAAPQRRSARAASSKAGYEEAAEAVLSQLKQGEPVATRSGNRPWTPKAVVFVVGDNVEVWRGVSGRWHSALVTDVYEAGSDSVDVAYDGGRQECTVLVANVRRVHLAAESDDDEEEDDDDDDDDDPPKNKRPRRKTAKEDAEYEEDDEYQEYDEYQEESDDDEEEEDDDDGDDPLQDRRPRPDDFDEEEDEEEDTMSDVEHGAAANGTRQRPGKRKRKRAARVGDKRKSTWPPLNGAELVLGEGSDPSKHWMLTDEAAGRLTWAGLIPRYASGKPANTHATAMYKELQAATVEGLKCKACTVECGSTTINGVVMRPAAFRVDSCCSLLNADGTPYSSANNPCKTYKDVETEIDAGRRQVLCSVCESLKSSSAIKGASGRRGSRWDNQTVESAYARRQQPIGVPSACRTCGFVWPAATTKQRFGTVQSACKAGKVCIGPVGRGGVQSRRGQNFDGARNVRRRAEAAAASSS